MSANWRECNSLHHITVAYSIFGEGVTMSKEKVCKVVRLQLGFLYDDQKKPCYPYDELREIQREVAEIKNRVIQLFWENTIKAEGCNIEKGATPTDSISLPDEKYRNIVYHMLRFEYPRLYSGNVASSLKNAYNDYDNAKDDIKERKISMLSYRSDAPIEIHNKVIKIYPNKQKYYVSIGVFSNDYQKEKNYPGTHMDFELYHLGGSQLAIVQRCISGDYSIGESKLIYSAKKRCWFLNLTYKFEPEAPTALDPERIMGVDLGINCVAYMGFNFCDDRFYIGRSEVEAFRKRTEARKRDLQRQGKYCGDGRIGHGYKTRNKPVLSISDAIRRFRDTANHKYSRYIVQKALEYGCGTIQMEDLKDFHNLTSNKFLRDWTYYDLRQKVEYKAREMGIDIKFVNPPYTSQRCSKCGHIDSANRPKEEKGQAYFECTECGFSTNADYNASLNLATKDIEKIIDAYLKKAEQKQT